MEFLLEIIVAVIGAVLLGIGAWIRGTIKEWQDHIYPLAHDRCGNGWWLAEFQKHARITGLPYLQKVYPAKL